jgi:hypothetical protein
VNDVDTPAHICDPQRPGDLILGVRRDSQIADQLVESGPGSGLPGLEALRETSRLDDIADRLSNEGDDEDIERPREESRERRSDGDYDFRLLTVQEGDEQIAVGSLIRLFLSIASESGGIGKTPPVIAQPNRILGFDSGQTPVALSADHIRYLQEMGLVCPTKPASYPRVRVVDSGCNGAQNVVLKSNLLDPEDGSNVDDDDGHGSLIAAIIDDITHGPFEIFKVADAVRKPTEWEVLQALSIRPIPPIINLSMSLGFGRSHCPQCGRRPVGARTAVFQERLRELAEAGAIVVAAAGNQGGGHLAFPSRFASAVAVEAYSSNLRGLAGYSNHGTTDETGAPHRSVFLCPGGDPEASEGPALERDGSVAYGTSYAAAYMSGLLAAIWAQRSRCTGACALCREGVLQVARSAASTSFAGYNQSEHGNGLARLT